MPVLPSQPRRKPPDSTKPTVTPYRHQKERCQVPFPNKDDPPSGVELPDNAIFQAILTGAPLRHKYWPKDFNSHDSVNHHRRHKRPTVFVALYGQF
ncbi:uncharacterized protein N7483_002203 [Penicillium malachiteum]|uniref:uncharacterized protein n=1 Tax=Penicillium malachiteum TaxID=1324776 RepID=UPI0025486C15|nr:uncharacterized protein N7483_002203 [Penicillium malachiteum]KAJ5737078.1 hypothetical protein N7483_002203 [Penicillium malachiteum]